MLTFLAEFVTHWHTYSRAHQDQAISDPDKWQQVVTSCPGSRVPAQREALLFFGHPDSFLPILSTADKRSIANAFASEIAEPLADLDENLEAITLALQEKTGSVVDYYASPFVERWRIRESRPMPDDEGQVMRRAWLVRGASVNGHNLVGEWLLDQFVSLAASHLRPLEPGVDQAVVKDAVEADYSHKSHGVRQDKTVEFHAFLSRMQPGDLVATTSDGLLHLGQIAGPPEFFQSTGNRSNLRRRVVWQVVESPLSFADLPPSLAAKLSSQSDVVDLTEDQELLETLSVPEPDVPAIVEPVLRDADDALADELLISREWLQETIELLRDRRQLIFYGPPGTGKTYLAQRLAWHLTERNAVKLVQFHPSYSYEDFFEGFRPAPGGDGTISFELRSGPFRRIVEAAKDDPSTPYVLIIDEINRANLAKVFGELYFLLEYRDEPVSLLYSQREDDEFTMPKNVYLIGTMNTADRSIALVDAAMRRRFAFVSLHPAEEPVRGLLGRWLDRHGEARESAELLAALNARIPDGDFAVGPSYLMKSDVDLDRVWRTSVLPLLEEIHVGDGLDVNSHYGLAALRQSLKTHAIADTGEAVGE